MNKIFFMLTGLTGLILMLAFSLPVIAADVIVVCNKNVTEDSLSKKEVRDIFLGKLSKWENKKKITFVTLDEPDIHSAFLKKYIRKTPSQFIRYWKNMVFTGRGRAPQGFPSEDKLIAFIAENEGAIGYMSADAAPDNLKIISE